MSDDNYAVVELDRSVISMASYMKLYAISKGGPGLKLKNSYIIKHVNSCGIVVDGRMMHVYEPIEEKSDERQRI